MDVGADGVGDRELVARFKETRDPAWFEPLFQRHRKFVYAFCYAMLENRAVAEDLLQDTFMKAYREIGRFNEADPESRFVA
jgi:RNA polymerase sigma-70 factor (ECF subfamily)